MIYVRERVNKWQMQVELVILLLHNECSGYRAKGVKAVDEERKN